MRKVYIVRENEEDGRLLEAMDAAGMSTEESEFDNPACPRCGSSTLLAYTKRKRFRLITWYEFDAKDGAGADAWYLVCSHPECTYEEEIERVFDPMGAEIFDQECAHRAFESSVGLLDRSTIGLRELAEYLRSALEEGENRKLKALLYEAEWRYKDAVEQANEWIGKLPLGKRIRFSTWDEQVEQHVKVEGTFVSATDEGLMLLRDPDQEVMLVRADEIDSWEPRKPETDEIAPRRPFVLPSTDEEGKPTVIMVNGSFREMVVVQGHDVRLVEVDRLGQYHVCTLDAGTAEALALKPRGTGYWEGVFRRSDVTARYDVQSTVKVKGYWLDESGADRANLWTAVRTHDPDIAAALGMKEVKPWFPPVTEEEKLRHRPSWRDMFRNEEIEERNEVRIYHWPLPELSVPDA